MQAWLLRRQAAAAAEAEWGAPCPLSRSAFDHSPPPPSAAVEVLSAAPVEPTAGSRAGDVSGNRKQWDLRRGDASGRPHLGQRAVSQLDLW